MDLVKARRRGNEGFRPTGRRRCQGRDGVSGRMVWGQGVVVTLLSREINDNGVENQAKLIIYVHQTILTFKNVLYNTGTFLYHKSIFLNAEHDNPVHVRAAGVIYKLITI
jgi:hypothetical protein